MQLKRGTRVKIIDGSSVEYKMIDSNGKERIGWWVRIDTGIKDKKGGTIKGWVVDLYLEEEWIEGKK